VRDALGARALSIEHVGSTSIPGLAAKPVIDMLLTVADTTDEAAYVPDLERAGFRLTIREPEWHEHRMFKGPRININLHVFSQGSTEIERMLTFRDRLRANAVDRRRYEDFKRELATREWNVVQDYADSKGTIVEEIVAAARAQSVLPAGTLRCFRCGAVQVDYRLCKVFCAACGGLIENCSGD